MNWNKIICGIIGTFIGSIVCILWLPLKQVVSIFIAISIAKFTIELLEFLFKKTCK